MPNIEFKKLNKIEKLILKLKNRKAYKDYKKLLDEIEYENHFLERYQKFEPTYQKIELKNASNYPLTFRHSGNSGDIIYSLPTILELSQRNPSDLYLEINVKADYVNNTHPLGTVRLNELMATNLIPLLEYQPFIKKASIWRNENTIYNLDDFRESPMYLDRGNIIRWYFYMYGINHDLSIPWLIAPKMDSLKNKIVISRSERYRNPFIKYDFLNDYSSQLVFVGVEKEYNDLKKTIPQAEFLKVNNFLELGQIINSCKLFIGNQSFPYSIAEGLKVPRVLEVCPICPNVIPEGKNGYDIYFQKQFEYIVNRLV